MNIVDRIIAKDLRHKFIDRYVDTSTWRYKEIEKIDPRLTAVSQIRCYLYDTLKDNVRKLTRYNKVLSYLENSDRDVYIMWDIMYDQEGEFGKIDADICFFRKYGYTSETMLLMKAAEAAELIRADNANIASYIDRRIPEDIYIFDDSIEWYIAVTHNCLTDNWNNENRTCFSNVEV